MFTPPGIDELRNMSGLSEDDFNELLAYMIEAGLLVKVNQEIVFSSQAIGKERKANCLF